MLAWLENISTGTLQFTLGIGILILFLLSQSFGRPRARPQEDSYANQFARRTEQVPGREAGEPRTLRFSEPLDDTHAARVGYEAFAQMTTVSFCCGALIAGSVLNVTETGASIHEHALSLLREAARACKVVLIVPDEHNSGGLLEAVLSSALEGAGILGPSEGQIPKHRLLVCTTKVGKIAMVRQVEPSLHFESDRGVHEELERFRVRQCLVMDGANSLVPCLELAMSGRAS